MAEEQLSDLNFVDDIYFSIIFDESDTDIDNIPVCDAKYAEALQFQEALMSSVLISQINNPSSASVMEPTPVKETGQSSQSFCEICAEKRENDQMFKTGSCVHSYCSDCICKHVSTKIQESITIVTCPEMECRAVLELDICRNILSKEMIDIWEQELCEEVIRGDQVFYCPFKDCSALMVNDNANGDAIRESECPFCHRSFCAGCYLPWHSGIECEDLWKLNPDERGKEDLLLMKLADDKKWSRCPKCRFYVERTEGCPHMTCRCKFEFCYGCAKPWSGKHEGCSRS